VQAHYLARRLDGVSLVLATRLRAVPLVLAKTLEGALLECSQVLLQDSNCERPSSVSGWLTTIHQHK
jgi:hypothetical protein